ncbi:hypothetical protein GCM10007863_34600 [Dyella mobilis]|nr:hypothetical protein GCM10007863_34600 [Dyella mobilis]
MPDTGIKNTDQEQQREIAGAKPLNPNQTDKRWHKDRQERPSKITKAWHVGCRDLKPWWHFPSHRQGHAVAVNKW